MVPGEVERYEGAWRGLPRSCLWFQEKLKVIKEFGEDSLDLTCLFTVFFVSGEAEGCEGAC